MELVGSIVALVTPMTETGDLDLQALKRLIEWHLKEGTQGFVIHGTTGEGATLSLKEQEMLLKTAIEVVDRRVPVVAGTGSCSTQTTIQQTEAAYQAGADAALVVTPYYNRPTQKGLLAHYQAVAANVPIPILLYNVPSRTACDLLPETIEILAETPNIIGIKEATGNLERQRQLLKIKDFSLFSGDDASCLMFILQGGKGVISVTANVAPRLMSEMCEFALKGKAKLAGEINTKLMGLHKNLFLEANPIPVKWALKEMGLVNSGIRLPLTPLSQKHQETVRQALNWA